MISKKFDESFYNKLPDSLITCMNKVRSSNFEVFIVGGACRNHLMNVPIHDFDLTSNATPDDILNIFKEDEKYTVIPTGEEFGTMTIFDKEYSHSYEITTYRSEAYTNMDRKPSSIQYEKSLIEDLKRRDFTINTIVYDTCTKTFIDHLDGLKHLEKKMIKTVRSPSLSFREDPLRMLRAIRFLTVFGDEFHIHIDDILFIKYNSALILNISSERIRDEFIKIITTNYAETAIWQLYDTGLLEMILPEVAMQRRFQQNNPHHNDYATSSILTLLDHTIAVVANSPNDPIVRMAALLHDIGKPYSIVVKSNEYWAFHNHPKKSADMAEIILNRLKYSTKDKTDILKLISAHDDPFTVDLIVNRKLVKKILNYFSGDFRLITMWAQLKRSDIEAHSNYEGKRDKYIEAISKFHEMVMDIIKEKEIFSIKDLAINGDDILIRKYPGSKGNKNIGRILNYLLDEVISDRVINDKNILLILVDELDKEENDATNKCKTT